jgi:hypothetical protein
MAFMMQSNLSKLSGIEIPTHTYSVQVVLLPHKLIIYYHGEQGMGELRKIK